MGNQFWAMVISLIFSKGLKTKQIQVWAVVGCCAVLRCLSSQLGGDMVSTGMDVISFFPQTVLALRGSHGYSLVPWISHIWSPGAAAELPAEIAPPICQQVPALPHATQMAPMPP